MHSALHHSAAYLRWCRGVSAPLMAPRPNIVVVARTSSSHTSSSTDQTHRLMSLPSILRHNMIVAPHTWIAIMSGNWAKFSCARYNGALWAYRFLRVASTTRYRLFVNGQPPASTQQLRVLSPWSPKSMSHIPILATNIRRHVSKKE